MPLLTSRITLTGPEPNDPEDILGSSLGVIFPDDVTALHGDAGHGVLYTSPNLPHPIALTLADVTAERERRLFSHYLWNSSLLLAEFIEAGTLAGDGAAVEPIPWNARIPGIAPNPGLFNITGQSTIELGAGTALPSILSALLGARRVVVTDYPSPPVIKTLRDNVAASVRRKFAPAGRFALAEGGEAGSSDGGSGGLLVAGHEWGKLENPLAAGNRHAFDRVIAADCLWMTDEHANLARSIEWFLGEGVDARAWVVAGFHTGRERMARFFTREVLGEVGLEVEYLWERDCDGRDREWAWDRGVEDPSVRKRWLAVAVLRRIRRPA